MITDFNEIENEEDRKIYMKMRRVLDTLFINTVREHETADHSYHECFQDDIKDCQNAFNLVVMERLNTIGKTEVKGYIATIAESLSDDLILALQHLIVFMEYCDSQDDNKIQMKASEKVH